MKTDHGAIPIVDGCLHCPMTILVAAKTFRLGSLGQKNFPQSYLNFKPIRRLKATDSHHIVSRLSLIRVLL